MARSEGLEPSTKVLETFVLLGKLRTHYGANGGT